MRGGDGRAPSNEGEYGKRTSKMSYLPVTKISYTSHASVGSAGTHKRAAGSRQKNKYLME